MHESADSCVGCVCSVIGVGNFLCGTTLSATGHVNNRALIVHCVMSGFRLQCRPQTKHDTKLVWRGKALAGAMTSQHWEEYMALS